MQTTTKITSGDLHQYAAYFDGIAAQLDNFAQNVPAQRPVGWVMVLHGILEDAGRRIIEAVHAGGLAEVLYARERVKLYDDAATQPPQTGVMYGSPVVVFTGLYYNPAAPDDGTARALVYGPPENRPEIERAREWRDVSRFATIARMVADAARTEAAHIEAPNGAAKLTKEQAALAVLTTNPDWTNKQIANKLGFHAGQLSRMQKFRAARNVLKEGRERYR